MGYGTATLLTIPLNIFGLAVIIACYLLSIKKLNEHRRNRQSISSTDKNIVFVAKMYLYATAFSYAPTLIWQIFVQTMPKDIVVRVDVYATLLVFFFLQSQSTISAIIFLRVNQASRQKIREFIRRCCSSNSPTQVQRNTRRVYPLAT